MSRYHSILVMVCYTLLLLIRPTVREKTEIRKFYFIFQKRSMNKSTFVDEASAERSVCEVVKTNPELQWRSQDVGDVRAMAHVLRKAEVLEWIKPKRETPCAVGRRTSKARIFKSDEPR